MWVFYTLPSSYQLLRHRFVSKSYSTKSAIECELVVILNLTKALWELILLNHAWKILRKGRQNTRLSYNQADIHKIQDPLSENTVIRKVEFIADSFLHWFQEVSCFPWVTHGAGCCRVLWEIPRNTACLLFCFLTQKLSMATVDCRC